MLPLKRDQALKDWRIAANFYAFYRSFLVPKTFCFSKYKNISAHRKKASLILRQFAACFKCSVTTRSSESPAAMRTSGINSVQAPTHLAWSNRGRAFLEQRATRLLFCLLLFHRRFPVDLSHQIIENLQHRNGNSLRFLHTNRILGNME